jgi:polar amino acid transport system substrate-binding protein
VIRAALAVLSLINSGFRARRQALRNRLRWLPLAAGLALALAPLAASAETVLEKALRTGELVMVGTTDSPPLLTLNPKGEPVGYAIEVGRRIDAELSAQLGGKVQIRFVPVANTAAMVQAVASGGAALACGVPFSWEREMVVDYSMPIGLSGLRLLTTNAAIDGSPASMAGRRIATVSGSLGATAIKTLQPAAKEVSVESLDAAMTALQQGKVDGVLGDSNVLAGLRKARNLSTARLLPDDPYATYGVGCILPENSSDFENVVNLAIAKLQAGYLEGRPDALASVDPWVGPNGVLGIPTDRIRTFFQSSLLSREALLLIPAPAPATKPAP